ncbi:MAG: radical SAM protein [Zetaproteobacteria bacterium]|nr:MAG: radical SAM protein [Zetaproteobacteria bacterium]
MEAILAENQVKGIERMAREATVLFEKGRAEYLRIEARTILNRCSSDRMPFAWTINPYRGCEFGCRYCYARYTHEFMGLERWEDFEQKIYVKREAARTLARELTPQRLRGQTIALGTATDPYQPAERRYRVTRSLLAVMAQSSELRLSITTKGDLVTRDVDLLRRIALRSSLHVNMTVTTLDRRLARILEFRAPTPDLRMRAVRVLRDAGLVAGVTLSPILPEITDTPENLEAVVAAARAHGATHVFWNVLFLKPSAQQAFFPFLERHFPRLAQRYAARFSRSAFLGRAYKDRISSLMDVLKRRHGFSARAEFEMPAPIHEADVDQLSLFPPDPAAPPENGLPCGGAPPLATRPMKVNTA